MNKGSFFVLPIMLSSVLVGCFEIENDAKIDNLVHIAHNCRIGVGAFVIATAILCGGVRIGEQAWVAPNSAIREHLTVGSRATVGLSATVVKDVPDDSVVAGSPATEVKRR